MKTQRLKALFLISAFIALSVISPLSSQSVPEHNPILFIHGWSANASKWDTMKQRFIDDGWSSDSLFAYTFANPNSGAVGINITNASQISGWVDQVLAQTGANRVDIICHSMGGVSTLYYLHSLGGAAGGKVTDVVFLDSSMKGNPDWLVVLAIPDMKPSTAVCKANAVRDQTPYGILADSVDPHVAGDMTYTCYWQKDSINTLDGATSLQFSAIAHNDFCTDAGIYEYVSAAVQANED
ncbi:MAG: alpha/beta hydrolase [Spirochaetes bacterium]|nr:MAG: alpha/beta hydrolase [Spirochaetota bacterium]